MFEILTDPLYSTHGKALCTFSVALSSVIIQELPSRQSYPLTNTKHSNVMITRTQLISYLVSEFVDRKRRMFVPARRLTACCPASIMAKRVKGEEVEPDGKSTRLFSLLPNELLFAICSYLGTREKLCLRLVNKRLYVLLSDSSLWTNVVINDAYHVKNSQYIKAALKVCKPHATYLCIDGMLPFSQYESTVLGFRKVEKLCLRGFQISKLAFGKIAKLSHLSSLTLTCGIKLVMNQATLSAFAHLKKLVLLFPTHTVMPVSYVNNLLGVWISLNCHPPLFCIESVLSTDRYNAVEVQICHTAIFCVYNKHKRPLGIPFYVRPLYSLCVGSSKEQICKISNKETSWYIKINSIVTPDCNLEPLGNYGVFLSPSTLSSEFQELSGHSICFLDLSNHNLTVECCNLIFKQCPNVVELSLSNSTINGNIDELFFSLPSICTRICGLNVSSIRSAQDQILDKQTFWQVLSSMTRLEYLTVSVCMFLPPVDSPATNSSKARTSFVWNLDTDVKNSMSKYMNCMNQLKALCALTCSQCSECTKAISLNLLQQEMFTLVSNFNGLHYLKVVFPKKGYRAISLGLPVVFQNCKKMSKLSITAFNLLLPNNVELYTKLTHLHIDCNCNLSAEFIDCLISSNKNFILRHLVLLVEFVSYDKLKELIMDNYFYYCQIGLSKINCIARNEREHLYKLASCTNIPNFFLGPRIDCHVHNTDLDSL